MSSIPGGAPLCANPTPSGLSVEERKRRDGKSRVQSPWCDPTQVQLSTDRKQLVEQHLYLIGWLSKLLHRKVRRLCGIDDLKQYAYLGLHQAALVHNPTSGLPFKPIAISRIQWAMIRGIREYHHFDPRRPQPKTVSLDAGRSHSTDDCTLYDCIAAPMPSEPDEADRDAEPTARLEHFLPAIQQPIRDTLKLRFIDRLSHLEIARRLGLRKDTVRQRLKSGLARLRKTVLLNQQLGNPTVVVPLPVISTKFTTRYLYVSDDHPERRFTMKEICDFANVSRGAVDKAISAGRPIGQYNFQKVQLQENEMNTTKEIPIDVIRTDGGTQIRVGLNEKYVAELMESLAGLPAPTVMFDGAAYWLADGFHRYAAHLAAKRKKILCRVLHGSKRDAVKYGLQANAKHGLRRSSQDKRNAVETCLADSEWSKLSDREIAEMTATSHTFVSNLRRLRGRRRNRAKSQPFPFIRFKQLYEQRLLQLIPREEIKDCEPVLGIRFADGRQIPHPAFGCR